MVFGGRPNVERSRWNSGAIGRPPRSRSSSLFLSNLAKGSCAVAGQSTVCLPPQQSTRLDTGAGSLGADYAIQVVEHGRERGRDRRTVQGRSLGGDRTKLVTTTYYVVLVAASFC